jgi:hypothetical protein
VNVAPTIALLVATAAVPAASARDQAPSPATATPAFSAAEAEGLARKLDVLARRSQAGKPPREKQVTVSESELNSYLNVTLGPKIPKGVSDVSFRFEQDRLSGRALVDLAELQDKVPKGSLGGLLSFLSGKVPLVARGRLTAADEGFGALAIEEVNLSTIPVPVSLVEQLVVSATKSAASPQGFDIHSPFRLPYALKRVRIQPGRALLEY